MMRRVVLSLALLTALAGCGADGEPVPPSRAAPPPLAVGF